jgi:hypothetical protein
MHADRREGPAAVNRRSGGLAWFALFVLCLGAIAFVSPRPDRVTDRDVYEASAHDRIVPDCTDLHCFRLLVPWTLGLFPGSSDLRWKSYAVACNAVAAMCLFSLCLTLGLTRRTARFASIVTAFGFGSLYTLHDPFTADPLMFALGPLLMDLLLRDHIAAAGMIGAIGVLGKEFAAAPLFIFTAWAALERRWATAVRGLAAANAAFIVWIAAQLTLMLRYNYGYGDSTSTQLLSGGLIVHWFAKMSLRGVLSAMFNEFGALYILAPIGFLLAPASLRRLVIVALPAAALFSYVQQPDRALWNFHFLIVPLGALVLDRAPAMLAWATIVAFAFANLRVGAQWPLPAARFALGLSVLLAIAAGVAARRGGATPSTGGTASLPAPA